MNSFATIEQFARYRTVTYYTVKCEDAALSEADDFFERMEQESDYIDQLERLVAWIESIGNDEEGAVYDLFRQERSCLALPPQGKYLDGSIDLRLYCYWVNENIVILYNGGIKTANNAQDCPNVSRHFYNAQSWTKQLAEIGIETNKGEITNLDELYIKY